ncbi:hypothetical protein LDENG_00057110 [Lucifuga dentata]|nr:hypothetical protein LDENG_00057110 [Lucifuga dentata]
MHVNILSNVNMAEISKVVTFCLSNDIVSPKIEKISFKGHTTYFACLSLIYSVFINVTLLTIISQSILLSPAFLIFGKVCFMLDVVTYLLLKGP